MGFSQRFSSFNRVGKSSQSVELENGASTKNEILNNLQYGEVDDIVSFPEHIKNLIERWFLNLKFLKFCIIDRANKMFNIGFVDYVENILGRVEDANLVENDKMKASATKGLDINDVQLIIQCEPPRDVETYIRRFGQTGREGNIRIYVMLYDKNKESIEKEWREKQKFQVMKGGGSNISGIWKTRDDLLFSFPIGLRKERIKDDGPPQFTLVQANVFGLYLLIGMSNRDWYLSIETATLFSKWITAVPASSSFPIILLWPKFKDTWPV
eukprot:Gb_02974 [translate_table: standard]